mgnify:CR=1 FL=1
MYLAIITCLSIRHSSAFSPTGSLSGQKHSRFIVGVDDRLPTFRTTRGSTVEANLFRKIFRRDKKDGEGDAGRKKRERRRSESPSRRSKKHRRDLDKDDGHRRRKRDRKSDRKTDRKTDKAGHEDRKAKIDVSKLHPLGPVAVSPPTSLIDLEADYFAYHSHLRLYMYRSGGIHFEDLTSEESREAFRKFASMYNAGRLEEAYYNCRGVPPEALEEIGGRTRHRWAFRTNKTEEESLRLVRAGVKKQTEWSKESAAAATGGGAGAAAGACAITTGGGTATLAERLCE